MTLLTTTPSQQTETGQTEPQSETSTKNKILEITTSTGYSHPSPMREDLKKEKQRDLESISVLFEQDLRDKGDYDPSKVRWINDQSVEIKDLPKMSLHNFILKAEELGLDISYTKQTIIKISN